MPQSITYKLLKGATSWYLIAILGLLQAGCSCLPTSSKEIDKARAKDYRDKKENELYEELDLEAKTTTFNKCLEETRSEINQLKGTSSSIDHSKEIELIKICKKFLQEDCIPYFQIKQEFLTNMLKYEIEPAKKAENRNELRKCKDIISRAEGLIRTGKVEELCDFIIGKK